MKIFDKLISGAKKAVSGFINNFASKALDKVTEFISPFAKQFLNSGVGKLAQKLIPNLAQKVDDFLNPAKLAAMFTPAQSPGDFAALLGPALRNVPLLGGLF